VNAITEAVRKRKRTCPSVRAKTNTTSRSTGRTTSWIQRGIRIDGGPELVPLTRRS
jgi:hypothetical protein